jgi:hypothetical protein
MYNPMRKTDPNPTLQYSKVIITTTGFCTGGPRSIVKKAVGFACNGGWESGKVPYSGVFP